MFFIPDTVIVKWTLFCLVFKLADNKNISETGIINHAADSSTIHISIQESYDGEEYEARILLTKGEAECLREHLNEVLSEID